VFAQVMQGALRLMGVAHDAPLDPIEMPARPMRPGKVRDRVANDTASSCSRASRPKAR
jgi:hypothetical protein